MATIVVEDGTGKTNSNSYVSEAELATYATDRGVTISGTDTVLLIQAMDYLEQQNFIGIKGTKEQALQWPRYRAVIDGYYVDSDEIPTLLKEAQMELVVGIDGGVNPMANEPRMKTREKIGDIDIEYSELSRNTTYLTAAETKLSKLTESGFGVYRA